MHWHTETQYIAKYRKFNRYLPEGMVNVITSKGEGYTTTHGDDGEVDITIQESLGIAHCTGAEEKWVNGILRRLQNS